MRTFFILVGCLSAWSALAQSDEIRVNQFNLKGSLAIQGYDPVSYFTQGRAEKGKQAFSVTDHGVTYYFASEKDRGLFQGDPAKYEPKYGGWCAYAMGHDGSKVEVDPGTFKIINGQLFLFYNQFFNNTLKSWNLDEPRLYKQAEANWQRIIQQNQKTAI